MQDDKARSWREVLSAYRRPQVVAMLFLGFSAGLPLLLIFSTLSLWLREAEVSRSTVTYFSWAALGYSFKFVWAPVIDKLPLPWLGRLGHRRSWLLLSQGAIVGAILWMAFTDPAHSLVMMAVAAVVLGFSSATQDIVIDAYRIESADRELQALLASGYIAGYRLGMLAAGAGALKLAAWFGGDGAYDYTAWRNAYLCMAAAMGIGIATTLWIPEPQVKGRGASHLNSLGDYLRFLLLFLVAAGVFAGSFAWAAEGFAWLREHADGSGFTRFMLEALHLAVALLAAWLMARLLVRAGAVRGEVLRETYVEPMADFFRRYGRTALLILALIATYRMSDIVLGVISNVFYQDLGFTKDQIADITKTFGLVMTLVGGFLGGGLALRFGVMRVLFQGAVLAAATNLLFILLAGAGPNLWLLILVIAADNLSAGMAGAAFVAYLSGLTSVSFTAFQYALFSSLMTLVPKLFAGYSGTIVDALGYNAFFLLTALLGVPVLLLILLARRLVPVEAPLPGKGG
jgi:MFS transporter, PAT family, beta-lactamase induction signal transducer AmpG